MLARVNLLAVLTGLHLAFVLGAASADPPADATSIDRRWLPSFGPTAGITIQKMWGGVESECMFGGPRILGPPPVAPVLERECESFPDPPEMGLLRPTASGSDLFVTPYVGGAFQILSPTIELFPGRPRFFATAEAAYLFGVSRDVAVEGDAGIIGYPTSLPPEERPFVSSPALTGKGSRVTAEIQPLGLSASLGLAFPLDVLGRRLWVKPLAGWYRYKVDLDTVVVGGYKEQCPTRPCPADAPEQNFRAIELGDSGSETFNSLGPGLELDLETGRFGPIGTSLYLGLYSYRVLGNRKLEFEDSLFYSALGGLDPPCPFPNPTSSPQTCGPADGVGGGPFGRADEYKAKWSWKAAAWIFRTGIGFRFHWLGFDK